MDFTSENHFTGEPVARPPETVVPDTEISMQRDTVMSKALEKVGVTLLRGHHAHTPEVPDGRITAVIYEDTLS